MLRGTCLRKEAPGETWSDKACDVDENQTLLALRRDALEATEWKKALVEDDNEHVASWDWLCAVLSAVRLLSNQPVGFN